MWMICLSHQEMACHAHYVAGTKPSCVLEAMVTALSDGCVKCCGAEHRFGMTRPRPSRLEMVRKYMIRLVL